ncbi:MAG: TonB-dependent receptor [Asticcacaulis sp.]|uniref:TonB-dependent receptor n=1 Tax=Asticcacaulis sp. TaxID=1872648 RepID=UPI0039E6AF94
MKTKAYILATASAVSILAMSGAALAQDANQTTNQTTTSTTTDQTSATPDSGTGDASTTVVVTGIRKSMASSRSLKKNSDQIVDAVVASEIGKLPDTTVSDSLARVTGVTVGRDGGEADSVLVRGLPNIATSYNGRDIFTAEGRFVASQDFAAGNVAALEVYKSTTADQVEGGIAGLINVRGRRPFDFKGREISGMVNYLYANQSKKYSPNGNFLISDRWATSHGEFGALLNVSYNRFQYLDSNRFIGNWVSASTGGNRFADDIGVNYSQHDRERPSANAALQWRPNQELELYADFLYQGYNSKTSDRNMEVPLWGGSDYSNIELSDDGKQIESMSVTNPVRMQGWQAGTTDHTDTWQEAIGAKWTPGNWTITTDLATTESKYVLSVYSLDWAATSTPTVNVDYNAGEYGGVNFTLDDFDTTDPSNFKLRGFYDRQLAARGRDIQFRTDAEYRTNLSWLPRVKFGMRAVDRKAGYDNGDRYLNVEDRNILMSDLGLDLVIGQAGFVGSTYPSVRSWVTPTYDSIRNNVTMLRQLMGWDTGAPPYSTSSHFTADEQSLAGFVQGSYAFNLGTVPVDGIVGVRVVKTDESVTSSQRTSDSDYTDTLPTASMRFHLSDKTQVRLAANKTRTRPNFSDLNPNYTVNPGDGLSYDGSIFYHNGGSSGNIDLKPYTSDNFDVTYEHYFGTTGLFAADLFNREVDGFINYHTITITDTSFTNDTTPDPDRPATETTPQYPTDTQNVKITVPYNSAHVAFKGAEVQFNTFFDFDFLPTWASHFGIQANATYMDSHVKSTAEQDKNQAGVSRLTGNLTGMFENGPWSARLTYNARSKWLSYCDTNDEYAGNPGCVYYKGTQRIDFSAGYKLSDNLSLSLDLNNLFPKPLQLYRVYLNDINGSTGGKYTLGVRTEETVYSVGIHFHY